MTTAGPRLHVLGLQGRAGLRRDVRGRSARGIPGPRRRRGPERDSGPGAPAPVRGGLLPAGEPDPRGRGLHADHRRKDLAPGPSVRGGGPAHSEIVNGTGLVVTNSGSTGSYRLGIRLQDLDPSISESDRFKKYESWIIGARSGTSSGTTINGAIMGDTTGTSLYHYGMSFLGTNPDLLFHSYGTGLATYETLVSSTSDAYVLGMNNRYGFDGRHGSSVGGEFPPFEDLSYAVPNNVSRQALQPVPMGQMAAGVWVNNVSGPVMTCTKTRIYLFEA